MRAGVLEREVVFHRYYDPVTGQFLSVDPAVLQTRQPYAFGGNDPINGVDPLGLCSGPDGMCRDVNQPGSQYVSTTSYVPTDYGNDVQYGPPAPASVSSSATASSSSASATHSSSSTMVNVVQIDPSVWQAHGLYQPQNSAEWFAAAQGPNALWDCEYGGGPEGCPGFGASLPARVLNLAGTALSNPDCWVGGAVGVVVALGTPDGITESVAAGLGVSTGTARVLMVAGNLVTGCLTPAGAPTLFGTSKSH